MRCSVFYEESILVVRRTEESRRRSIIRIQKAEAETMRLSIVKEVGRYPGTTWAKFLFFPFSAIFHQVPKPKVAEIHGWCDKLFPGTGPYGGD